MSVVGSIAAASNQGLIYYRTNFSALFIIKFNCIVAFFLAINAAVN